MAQKIYEKINSMNKISLKESDFIGQGTYGKVYHYQLNNIDLAVKYFEKENAAL